VAGELRVRREAEPLGGAGEGAGAGLDGGAEAKGVGGEDQVFDSGSSGDELLPIGQVRLLGGDAVDGDDNGGAEEALGVVGAALVVPAVRRREGAGEMVGDLVFGDGGGVLEAGGAAENEEAPWLSQAVVGGVVGGVEQELDGGAVGLVGEPGGGAAAGEDGAEDGVETGEESAGGAAGLEAVRVTGKV